MKFIPETMTVTAASVAWDSHLEALELLHDWHHLNSTEFDKKWGRTRCSHVEWDRIVGESAMRMLDEYVNLYPGRLIP